MSDLNKLYDPVIRAYQANPYHFKKVEDASITVKAYNPICGDRYDFFPEVKEGVIRSFYFHGFGCAVSMAAGSVLVKSLEGKTIKEAIDLCTGYLEMLNGKSATSNAEWNAFSAVRDFPSRHDCAAMAWEEVKKFLQNL
jgi:nitrogen fixation NifU-like protein